MCQAQYTYIHFVYKHAVQFNIEYFIVETYIRNKSYEKELDKIYNAVSWYFSSFKMNSTWNGKQIYNNGFKVRSDRKHKWCFWQLRRSFQTPTLYHAIKFYKYRV